VGTALFWRYIVFHPVGKSKQPYSVIISDRRKGKECAKLYDNILLAPQFEQFLLKKDFKEALSVKMDYVIFNNYLKEQLSKEVVNDKEFKIEERLFMIEKNLQNQVSKEELKSLLKMKATNERLVELRESVQKV